MNGGTWYLLAGSAMLYASAFFWPAYCFWLVFIAFTPIFYLGISSNSLSFFKGFFWGIIFFSLHWVCLLYVIIERGQGQWRFLVYIFLIMYSAIYSGLWFLVAQRLRNFFPFAWVTTTWLFLYFITNGVFWVFGNYYGYVFTSPLVPLAYYPQFLTWLPMFSESIFIGLILLTSWFFSLFLYKKSLHYLLFILLLLTFFGSGFFISMAPDNYSKVFEDFGYISSPKNQRCPLDCAQEITYQLIDFIENYPEKIFICMSESSFPFPLNEYPQFINLWTHHALFENRHLLIGSHRSQGEKLYNCLYWIHDGKIIDFYDKQTLVPFTEYVPFFWAKCNYLNYLFLASKCIFSSQRGLKDFMLADNVAVSPLICSDIYLGCSIKKVPLPILLNTNESWFSCSYIQELFVLFVRLKTISWGQEIAYIGYRRAFWLDTKGNFHKLAS